MPSNITGSENKSKCEVVGIKSKKENVMNTSPKIIFECTKESRRLPKAASSNNLHS